MKQSSLATRKVALLSCIALMSVVLVGCPKTACVDFGSPAIGTQYGAPAGQTPGTVVFTTQEGIPVSVQDFVFLGGSTGTFKSATIGNPPVPFGNGKSINTNNINLEFDFSRLDFHPSEVTFDFLHLGGFENISVNGIPMPPFAGELSAAPTPLGGVSITVSTTPVAANKKGTVTLKGEVRTLRIGGQELWIDNVCARGDD